MILRFRKLAPFALSLLLLGCSSGEGSERNNCVGACKDDLEEDEVKDLFGPADPGDWTTFRADSFRTGHGPGSVVGDEVEVVWQRENFMERDWSAVKSSGAVWGDTLFYPSDEGTLYAFDRMTGDVRWEHSLIGRNPGIHSSPLVTKSTVCIGTYAGNLHCLDRESGDEIWKYKIGNVIGSSPVYVPEDNAIYVSHETPKKDPWPGGGYVTKNDPRTGEEIWVSPQLRHWPHASVAVHPGLDVVVVGANDGVLHGYDTETGEELWDIDFESEIEGHADIKTTAAISESRGLAYLGTWDENLYAVELETGDIAWEARIGARMQGSPALDETNGRVFQGGSGANSLSAWNADDGTKLWNVDLGGAVSSSPAISGDRGRVVVGTNANQIVAVDAETGETVWTFDADGPVNASPILVGDMIYVAARHGSLYALRTK